MKRQSLVCTACATPHGIDERFCPDCGLPLVLSPEIAAAAPPITPAQERARKIRPQYAEGPLVTVAAARHQAEAELLQGMLLEEGIPSLVRRSGGFDVPDFLAAGPRDLLVPQSGESAARETLGPPAPPQRRANALPWVRALAAALAFLIIATVAAGVIAAIAS
jgi:hypothetical protein